MQNTCRATLLKMQTTCRATLLKRVCVLPLSIGKAGGKRAKPPILRVPEVGRLDARPLIAKIESGRSCLPPLLEALAAEDRSALCRPERHCSLFSTLRARGASFDLAETASVIAAGNGSQHGHALGLTGFTTLGFVPERLVVKEQLFPSCEDKIRAAVDTV